MSLKGYVKKGHPALWTTTPSGAAAIRLAARRKQRQRAPNVRRRIAAATPQMQARRRRYLKQRDAWLSLPENKLCGCCKVRKASECHHSRGRRGDLLLAERFWIAVCSDCHQWIHNNMAEARRMGMLCEVGQWDTMPKEL